MMKYFKKYNDISNNYIKESINKDIEYYMSDEDNAIEYLKSIDFFDSHGFDEEDEIIIDNIGDIIYRYRHLKDDYIEIYRALAVPSIEYIDLKQVGYFWSFSKNGVGTYDSGMSNDFNKEWKNLPEKEIILTATTHKNNISWLDSLVANAIYGDEQSECYLKKGSSIIITHIDNIKLDNNIKAVS